MPKTLQSRGQAELVESAKHPLKGSRFIASASSVQSEEEAKAFLAEVTAQMSDARHHCAAWRIASPAIDRALDAGEPSGSAGRPILSQLTGRDLVDVCVVVTRYFGGVKLGVGGLVRAYGGAAAALLDSMTMVERLQMRPAIVEHTYEDGPLVDRVLAQRGLTEDDVEYGEAVRRRLSVPSQAWDELAAALADATGGRVRLPE